MSSQPWFWIMVATGAVLLALLVLVAIRARREKRPPDYFAIFIMGVVWLLTGLSMALFVPKEDFTSSSWGFAIMGLAFMILGLAHRDKWKENRRTWSSLTPEEKKFKTTLLVILGILVLAGLAAALLFATGSPPAV